MIKKYLFATLKKVEVNFHNTCYIIHGIKNIVVTCNGHGMINEILYIHFFAPRFQNLVLVLHSRHTSG